ncbi:MAG: OmpA family protein [Bryobacteraceae bacterium]
MLWLLNSSKEIQKAVGGYFKDPSGKSKEVGNGEGQAGESVALMETTLAGTDLSKLKEKIQAQLKKMPELKDKFKDQVEMTVAGAGLRIEMLESVGGFFFESGNASPTERGKKMLAALAGEIGKLPNSILIEGHTDSRPYVGRSAYGNWELASDRANAARRHMESVGLRPGQIAQVRGYADQNLRKVKAPDDPQNRRISIVVQYEKTAATKAPQAQAAVKTPAPHH